MYRTFTGRIFSSSAGARMAAWLGTYGPAAFGGEDLPRPGTMVMQYTGLSEYSPQDPPTYACVGKNDGIAVITNEELKVKTGRDYAKCSAKFVLMDPAYTFSVPVFQMVSGGFDTLSRIMEIYFSAPDEENVSGDVAEALMRGVIRDLRAAIADREDYTARSNLMWESAMAGNRILKLGEQADFQCRMMEHQLAAYTGCDHGAGLAVLHPAYCRRVCGAGAKKFARFAVRVWNIPAEGRTEEELARAGVEALADFIREIGQLLVLDVRPQSCFPERGFRDQHAGGQAFAHEEEIMGWIFSKSGGAVIPGELEDIPEGYTLQPRMFPGQLLLDSSAAPPYNLS